MATATTTNLGLTTVETGDVLPEAVVKDNFETLDAYSNAIVLTNKSGAQRTAGEVVIVGTGVASSFLTTTTAGDKGVLGVVQATIENNATGLVRTHGVATQVKVTGATSIGAWLTTSTTAGQAVADGVAGTDEPPPGAFAIALSSTAGAGNVSAMLISPVRNTSFTSDGGTLASASTLTLGSDDGDGMYDVSGTTTITAISSRTSGRVIMLRFTGQCSVTYNATSMILKNGKSMALEAGDILCLVSEGSGNWRELWTKRAHGAQSLADNIAGLNSVGLCVLSGFSGGTISGPFNTSVASSGSVGSSGGIVTLGSGGTGGAYATINGPQSLTPSLDWTLRARLKGEAVQGSHRIMCGATNQASPDDHNNIIAFRMVGTTGTWEAVTDNAGTETATDTGIAYDTTVRDFEIRVRDGGTNVYFYIDGALVATHTTNIYSGSLTIRCGVGDFTSGQARNLSVYSLVAWRED